MDSKSAPLNLTALLIQAFSYLENCISFAITELETCSYTNRKREDGWSEKCDVAVGGVGCSKNFFRIKVQN